MFFYPFFKLFICLFFQTDFSFTEDYGSGFPDANYLDG